MARRSRPDAIGWGPKEVGAGALDRDAAKSWLVFVAASVDVMTNSSNLERQSRDLSFRASEFGKPEVIHMSEKLPSRWSAGAARVFRPYDALLGNRTYLNENLAENSGHGGPQATSRSRYESMARSTQAVILKPGGRHSVRAGRNVPRPRQTKASAPPAARQDLFLEAHFPQNGNFASTFSSAACHNPPHIC